MALVSVCADWLAHANRSVINGIPRLTGERPPDILCKTLFYTKGPFQSPLFRSLDIRNVTGWIETCIVTDPLGAFCPCFDSWELVTAVTGEFRVSASSHVAAFIPTF